MTTDDQGKLVTRKLKQWIENDRKVVTFRDVSREIGCHVNHAKNLLLNYHSTHPTTATYLLTGPLLRTSTLAQTQLPLPSQSVTNNGGVPNGTQSLAHLAKKGAVKIVDMDEMSDDERNSEHGDGDDEDTEGMGNDDGAEAGLVGDGTRVKIKVKEEDEVVKSEEVRRWGVVLVSEEGLDEKKALFEEDKLNIHVYALSPAVVKDPAQYLLSPLNLRTLPNYFNPTVYGTYIGDGIKTALATNKDGGMKNGGIDFGKGAVSNVKVAKSGSISTSKSGKEVQNEKQDDKEKDKAKAKQTEQSTRSLPKETAKVDQKVTQKSESSTNLSAPSQSKSRSKKRIIQSDDEDEAEATDKSSPPPVASSSKQTSATAATGGTVQASCKSKLEPTSSIVRAEDTAAMEAMMGMDMDVDLDEDGDDTPGAKSKKNELPKLHQTEKRSKAQEDIEKTSVDREPGVRKRRKVKKSKMEMDERGYMDYETDESYSGDSEPESTLTKSKSKPAAKARPSATGTGSTSKLPSATPSTESIDKKSTNKPAAKSGGATGSGLKKGPGGQTSLQGFFKRK